MRGIYAGPLERAGALLLRIFINASAKNHAWRHKKSRTSQRFPGALRLEQEGR
jgi:hypothetical protein